MDSIENLVQNDGESPTDSFTERPLASSMSGCLYALFVVVLSGALLLVNAILCIAVYSSMPKYQSENVAHRVGQLFYFIAPVVLLIIEWNLLDRIQRLFDRD